MTDSDQAGAAGRPDSPIRRLRLLSRLAIALLLDVIGIARGGRHIMDTLLLGVIVQANVGAVGRPTDLQVSAEGFPGQIADDMRRPIPVNAIAASLGLPFETVRRRVRKLAAAGLCRLVSAGVIVPSDVLGRPECEEMARRAYERVRAFYHQASDLDLLAELPRPSARLGPSARPLPASIRLTADYVLREVAGLLETMGGPIDGLIAFEVFRANTAHFSHHLRGGEGYAADDMVADGERRPVRIPEVAARLGMPQETVRRHLVLLLDRGVCRRVSDGVIMPADVFARTEVREAIFGNAANLNRLLAGLARLGVLDLWDRTRSISAATAPLDRGERGQPQ